MKLRDLLAGLLLAVLLAGVALTMTFDADALADRENSVVVWLQDRDGTGEKLGEG